MVITTSPFGAGSSRTSSKLGGLGIGLLVRRTLLPSKVHSPSASSRNRAIVELIMKVSVRPEFERGSNLHLLRLVEARDRGSRSRGQESGNEKHRSGSQRPPPSRRRRYSKLPANRSLRLAFIRNRDFPLSNARLHPAIAAAQIGPAGSPSVSI